MLLDDERFLLEMYKISFEKTGQYEAALFYDADTALAALHGGYEPDVILFDITMPDGRSGYEFIETVSAEKLAKRALKLALTNQGQDGAQTRTAELGAHGHLLKVQNTPSEIVAKVSEMLGARA